jgi:hypothetical protein
MGRGHSLSRKLVEAGCPSSAPLEAYRGTMLCLTIRSIGEAAELETDVVRFSRAQRRRTAPPMSLTALSSVAAQPEPRNRNREATGVASLKMILRRHGLRAKV